MGWNKEEYLDDPTMSLYSISHWIESNPVGSVQESVSGNNGKTKNEWSAKEV